MKLQLITKFSRHSRQWSKPLLGLLIVVQLFVPLMSAASSMPAKEGQYITICTLQGLQQILISEEGVAGEQADLSQPSPTECPLCSLTHLYMSALSVTSPDSPKDPSRQGYPIPETEVAVIDRHAYDTPARAPPLA